MLRICFACSLLAVAALGADPSLPPRPRYEVKRVSGRLNIDGRLDEKAWQEAAPIVLVFPWENQTGAKQKTAVRLLWDDQNLYVGYECEDADITAQFTNRDDPTYRDDAVEIFVNARPAQLDVYYGLEMNARAVLYDYVSFKSSAFLLKRLQFEGVQLATYIDGTLNARGDQDRGWSLEVAIPFQNFDELSKRPEEGTLWTAALNRWDGVNRDRRLSMWTDPGDPRPNPHRPERFGELVFRK